MYRKKNILEISIIEIFNEGKTIFYWNFDIFKELYFIVFVSEQVVVRLINILN